MQDAPAASVAPDKLAVPDPAVAVMVPPPHDPVRPLGVETIRPAGSVSENATPVSAPEVPVLGLVIVNDSEVVPPTRIDAAPNALEMVGADGADVMKNTMPLLVPPGVVTVTCTPPLPAGTVAVMLVGLLTVNAAVAVLPPMLKLTAVAPVKLLPPIASDEPVAPLAGLSDVSCGAWANATPGVSSNSVKIAKQRGHTEHCMVTAVRIEVNALAHEPTLGAGASAPPRFHPARA